MKLNEEAKTLFWIMFFFLLVFISGTVIFWNKYEGVKSDYMALKKEATSLLTEVTELQGQIDTLTKGNKNIVPIINKLRPQLDNSIVKEVAEAIVKYSREYRFPPEFVTYVIQRESNFNVLAISSKGAVGLMQVLPKYHGDKMKKMGINSSQLYHIDNNVKLGCWILRDYYNETGSIEKALTKYVGGNHNGYIDDILIGYTNETIPKVKKK
jgi:hypothetical protein